MHHLVASYLGYEHKVQTPAQQVTDIDAFLPSMGPMPIRRMQPLDTSAFDAETTKDA